MIRYFMAAVLLLSLCSCNNGGGSGPIEKIKDEALSAKPKRLPDSGQMAVRQVLSVRYGPAEIHAQNDTCGSQICRDAGHSCVHRAQGTEYANLRRLGQRFDPCSFYPL